LLKLLLKLKLKLNFKLRLQRKYISDPSKYLVSQAVLRPRNQFSLTTFVITPIFFLARSSWAKHSKVTINPAASMLLTSGPWRDDASRRLPRRQTRCSSTVFAASNYEKSWKFLVAATSHSGFASQSSDDVDAGAVTTDCRLNLLAIPTYHDWQEAPAWFKT
jgi:hypothetical protein